MNAAIQNSRAWSRSRSRVRGFTLVELMVALLIGLFLIGGLLTLVFGMKRTNTNQGGLSQLQDEERVAMNMITDVVQSAGFYSNPVVNTLVGSFPATTNFSAGQNFTAGQSILGTGLGTAAAPGDSISIRYNTTGGDGIINCIGGTSAVAATFVNTFSINGGNLQCVLTVMTGTTVVSTTTATLVTGVTNLQFYYGLQTNAGSGTSSVDTYLDAPAMTAGSYWSKVISVQVTLTFTNPLAGLPGQTGTAKQTIPFTRMIGVMNKTGVNT